MVPGGLARFAVQGAALEKGVVFLFLKTLRVCLKILFRSVARGRFTFFARFSALERDDTYFAFFLCHISLRNRTV